ncbi:MAG TPA: hypothetical protein DER56_02260 [Thermosipho africanus]|nr:hypothetical protein [Thermosipho africanus]
MTEFIMLVGIPGSGKSHIAKMFKGYDVFSSDKIREELTGDASNQEFNKKVFEILHKNIFDSLKNRRSSIYDATNLSSKRRRRFIETISKLDVHKVALVVATPFEECVENNQNRERVVPDYVMDRMYKSFQIPIEQEGFDTVQICYNNRQGIENYDLATLMKKAIVFDQKNKHHSHTLGEHMDAVGDYVFSKPHCFCGLYLASAIHDIGKLKTQVFKDGDASAHYYNHENVGAYDAMFVTKLINDNAFGQHDKKFVPYYLSKIVVDVCKYINWHMYPYSIKSEKTKEKFIDFVGKDFYDAIMLLHEADLASH